jgi:hypothetical protein
MAEQENTSTSNTVTEAARIFHEGILNNPAMQNPLIPSGHPEDTMAAVCDVLSYLAYAAEAGPEKDVIPAGAAMGLSRILDTCRAALNFHRLEADTEGGAA